MDRAERDLMDSAFDELDPDKIEAAKKANERAGRRAKALQSQRTLDLAELMKSASFRRFIFTVLGAAGIYSGVRHAQHTDYAFDAGRRALGLELLSECLEIDPDFAIDLSVEQAKLEKKVNDVEPRNAQ